MKTYKQLVEAAYAGNLGGMELFQFYADSSVPKRDKERHKDHINSGRFQRANKMVQSYIAKKFNKPDFKFNPSIYPKKQVPQ